MITDQGKRLPGTSDMFDSDSQMSKLQLSMFAAIQEWFDDQRFAKVIRGMDDNFRCGNNLELPTPGYSLKTLNDE